MCASDVLLAKCFVLQTLCNIKHAIQFVNLKYLRDQNLCGLRKLDVIIFLFFISQLQNRIEKQGRDQGGDGEKERCKKQSHQQKVDGEKDSCFKMKDMVTGL